MSKLLKNSLIYTIGNTVTALTAFFLLPLYTTYLTVSDFGITNSMQIISGVLAIILPLALERSLFRIYHDYPSMEEKKDFLGTIFISITISGAVGVPLCIVLGPLLNRLFPSIPFHPYFTMTIFNAFALCIISFTQTLAQVRQHARQFIFISISMLLFTVCANLLFILKFKQGALGYLKGTLYGTLCVLPFALYYIHQSINYTFNRQKFKAAFLYTLPVLPSLLAAWVLNLSDRVFIDKFYSQADVGIYSLGYRLASIVMFVSSAVFMAYNPLFFNIANDQSIGVDERKNKIYKINSAIIIGIGVIGIGLLGSSDFLLDMFFPPSYRASYAYISVLILSFIIAQITGLFNLMVYQNKKTKPVAVIIIICAALNISLNYFLIPAYGVYYAVITSLVCNIVNFVLIYLLAKQNFFIRLEWSTVIKIGFCYGLIYLENHFLKGHGIWVMLAVKVPSLLIVLYIFKGAILTLYGNLKRN